jgi:uncharacterized OB-fold protein
VELPRYHRLRSTFYRMEAKRCSQCGATHFPPRNRCHECGSGKLEDAQLSGRGRLISFAQVFQPARGFNDNAGALTAMVELEEGVRVIAQLTDAEPEEIEIGQEVEMVVRRLRTDEEQGLIVYGYKFRPLLKAQAAPA